MKKFKAVKNYQSYDRQWEVLEFIDGDYNLSNARFYGPNARRYAQLHAKKLNEKEEGKK
jgi:hypothetical protein